MKRFSEIPAKRRLLATPLALAALLATSSCSMMHDDLPECATRPLAHTYIHFSYDYNTYGENHFLDDVGSVTLYVCDENGLMLQQIEHIVTPEEIEAGGTDLMLDLPAGEYQLYAAGHATDQPYEQYLLSPGARFRRSDFTTGMPASDFYLALDHNAGVVDHQQMPLEHLWVTHHMIPLTVEEPPMPEEGAPQPEDVYIEAVVELQRVTNNLHLTLVKGAPVTRAAETVNLADYEVWVESKSHTDRMDLVGNPAQGGTLLKYTPHNMGAGTKASSILADISTSRLFYNADSSKNARLFVKSNTSGETFSWDLPELLTKGLEADAYASQAWTRQEYLDREYEYNLSVEFNEKDDGWRYIDISIAQLNWTKRIQNVEL